MNRFIGIDGCKAGWIAVRWNGDSGSRPVTQLLSIIAELTLTPRHIVAIDMPIGFMDTVRKGGRDAEREARRKLPGKTSSVFSAPCRAALEASTHAEASKINRANSSPPGLGLSIQSASILPKMREVDRYMTPAKQSQIFETHPELIFTIMNGDRPVLSKKRSTSGQHDRIALLQKNGFPIDRLQQSPPSTRLWSRDDLIDACACSWSARRILDGHSSRLPSEPPRDARGLRMEINA